MKYWMVKLLILTTALVCYALGVSASVVPLIVVGGAFELWFWVRTLRSDGRKTQ
jgi:ABC-type methionine transport system permease subunit